jgi:hypothetical protein
VADNSFAARNLRSDTQMAAERRRVRKHFELDPCKLNRAQRLLGAKTETIERALDLVLSEHRRNRFALEENDSFECSGAAIKDAYGNLHQ